MNRNALKSTGHQQAILASLGLDGSDFRHVSRRQVAATTRNHRPTVAQTLGLLPKPKTVDWEEIESSAIKKGHFDSACAICLTRHGQKWRKSVITSCGHVFHQPCLKATRQNQAAPKCPLCRDPYTSRLAKKGLIHARRCAVIQIQSTIRGWLTRRKMARRYPNTFKRETRKIRLQDFGRHVDRGMSKLQKDSEDLVIQSEIALEKARQIFSQIKLDPDIIDDQYREARKRAQPEALCPVCLVNLGPKPISLLSCGHVLHVKCRVQLESFVDQISCPLCRSPYTFTNSTCSAC